jgi:hypothetical protein
MSHAAADAALSMPPSQRRGESCLIISRVFRPFFAAAMITCRLYFDASAADSFSHFFIFAASPMQILMFSPLMPRDIRHCSPSLMISLSLRQPGYFDFRRCRRHCCAAAADITPLFSFIFTPFSSAIADIFSSAIDY